MLSALKASYYPSPPTNPVIYYRYYLTFLDERKLQTHITHVQTSFRGLLQIAQQVGSRAEF